ncbi:sulfurtransferase [Nitrincola sp. A-D6]|uniref:sulfurtransferase n=1 Tax=Nitrincola sp. A-D6 TaxID=1545442 RepID=UPI000B05EE93|nr:sulfurtransferase [Nitrincola sp. A-D6]
MRTLLATAALSVLLSTPVLAMGLTPEETYALKQEQGDQILFIDVRDPVEVMFIGSTDVVDANIPFMQVDRYDWDAENNRFRMSVNPNFAAEVEALLEARGLDKSAQVITMCRSGSERGEPSALYLQEQGFSNTDYVINGFQAAQPKKVHSQVCVWSMAGRTAACPGAAA